MSDSNPKETSKQFKGLPSTVYVNSHLLKAALVANKIVPLIDHFDHHWLRSMSGFKEGLDNIERLVEFRGVYAQKRDGSRQKVDQSKLYDLEKYEKFSSDLKRRSLTRKGSKRFLDALICYWFTSNKETLQFRREFNSRGQLCYVLELDNPSSPKNYSILFSAFGEYYEVTLKGSGLTRRRKRRATGRTSNKTVAAETIQQDDSQGSKRTSVSERLQRAVQAKASKASVNLSSSGPSYPGE